MLEENIRVELNKYKTYIKLACLECGYEGLMGEGKSIIPGIIIFFVSFGIAIVAFIISVGIFGGLNIFTYMIGGIAWALTESSMSKKYAHCPNCKSKLIPK